jgi:hypothetical protein
MSLSQAHKICFLDIVVFWLIRTFYIIETRYTALNNSRPCIKLIRYGNETSKCIETYKSTVYYIINIVCFLQVSATPVAILREVNYKGCITKVYEPYWNEINVCTHTFLSFQVGDILRISYTQHSLHSWINHKFLSLFYILIRILNHALFEFSILHLYIGS